MQGVIAAIKAVYPVGEKAIERLTGCMNYCSFPRHAMLVKSGEQCGYAYFIERGVTRSFWLVDGEEITTSFSIEGGVVFSMDEFYYGHQSEEYVEALEPVDLYAVRLDDLRTLFAEEIDFANWGRVIHQNEYRRIHQSHKERLTLSAKDRYAAFKNQFPEVCNRVNLGYIASYLGITLSTLSRLRRGK